MVRKGLSEYPYECNSRLNGLCVGHFRRYRCERFTGLRFNKLKTSIIVLKKIVLLGLVFQFGVICFCIFDYVIFTRYLTNQWLQLVIRDLYQFYQQRHYFFFLMIVFRTLTSTYAEEYQRNNTEDGHCTQHVKHHCKSTIASAG